MGVVVNSAFSTAGNGGRKLVRLSNGWLVATVIDYVTSGYPTRLYISKDNGETWSTFGVGKNTNSTSSDVALVTDGENVYHLIAYYNSEIRFDKYDSNGVKTINNIAIDTSQTVLGNVSMAVDPTNGYLHATWSSKNSTYPNCFNIRYSNSVDGGATWSVVEQVTQINTSGRNYTNPSIVVRNNQPTIIIQGQISTNYYMYANTKTGSGWFTDSLGVGKSIHSVGTYPQSNPSAVVDIDGVIHVAWNGSDSTNTAQNIRYSKSTDGGTTWSSQVRLTDSTGSYHSKLPSITVDKVGKIVIVYELSYDDSIDVYQLGYTYFENNTWNNRNIYDDFLYSPSTLYDPTFSGKFDTIPPFVYEDRFASGANTGYMGAYIVNTMPILTLKDSQNQIIANNQIIKISEKQQFDLNIVANDVDTSDTLQYSVYLRGNIYKSWTAISKNQNIQFSILFTDLLIGNNMLEVRVKDDSEIVSTTFIIRNLTPESYSQQHVFELIMEVI